MNDVEEESIRAKNNLTAKKLRQAMTYLSHADARVWKNIEKAAFWWVSGQTSMAILWPLK